MTDDQPLPSHPQARVTSPFWEATADERLLIQQCESCDRHVFHPRSICPYCLSDNLSWVEASGDGTVYSSNVIYESPVAYFDERTPYVVGIVHLAEDVYMFTEFVCKDPDTIEIGMPVEVTFERVSEDITLPKFRPDEANTA